jgi:hypothetical protein
LGQLRFLLLEQRAVTLMAVPAFIVIVDLIVFPLLSDTLSSSGRGAESFCEQVSVAV